MVSNILNMIQTKIDELDEEINCMNTYLSMKQKDDDYHAVADAAMDIREYRAKQEAYSDALNMIKKENENEKTNYPDTDGIFTNK